jgi:hypothetical protein
MIKLTYDPSVLIALHQAFPKPKNSAQKALDKYINLLEGLFHSSMFKRSTYAQNLKAYDIPLTPINRRGPTIKNKNNRVHRWLERNGYALVINLRPSASNLTKEHALLKPTKLLTVSNADLLGELRILTPIELNLYFNTLTQDWIDKVNVYQDEYLTSSTSIQKDLFFTTDIDIESVKNYMRKVVDKSLGLNRTQEASTAYQAEYILRIAQVNNGKLHQKIDKKAFGRTYYEGLSVTNVSKELREAMLGDSWEYDSKSCSTAWKMSFAQEWYDLKKRRKLSLPQMFNAMTWFLKDKPNFYQHVSSHTFQNSTLTQDEKNGILKEAMTALGFGAKLGIGKWLGMFGEERMTSLYEVFNKDMATLTRFVNCPIVQKFNKEQQILNKYIVEKFSVDSQWRIDMDLERQRKKMKDDFSQAQKVVWLFQHAETLMMDIVRKELNKLGKTVLANVHDAIVVRERLTALELQAIEKLVRRITKVEYFALGETQYSRHI